LYYYYAPPYERKPYDIAKNDNDTIRVAYIGDSWAFYHTPYDDRMADSLSQTIGRPVMVNSIGFCGRTSKEIYWRLFDNPEMKSLISKGYDYCVISAGINDSNKKMSTNYYKRSMECIINFMLFNNITPIIIEIPDYDIEKMYRWEIPSRKPLRILSKLLTGTSVNCKKDFRQAFNELLKKKEYNKVHVIRYKAWNSNYAKDMKTLYVNDGIHLNEKGYAKLDSCIIDMCNTTRQRNGEKTKK
jgi:lysophospholipase L1-like esterase